MSAGDTVYISLNDCSEGDVLTIAENDDMDDVFVIAVDGDIVGGSVYIEHPFTFAEHEDVGKCVFPARVSEWGYRFERYVVTTASGQDVPLYEYEGFVDEWCFNMPAENVTVSAVFTPVFMKPSFTLPAALTAIEESAFEGLPAMKVVDAKHCASIGKWAFRDCAGLRQIRLPKDCAIDASAFEGCGTVTVFAPAGGATEACCRDIPNASFAEG